MKRIINQQYKDYRITLSNFRTILKDTKNQIIKNYNSDYNCMSYAFGIFNDWCEPTSFRDLSWCHDYEDDDLIEELLLECAQELIDDFGCRSIKSPAEVQKGERAIAFRVGFNDFHFARQHSDGTWSHKTGGGTIKVMSEKELYGECWCDYRTYPYTSSVLFFAIKK